MSLNSNQLTPSKILSSKDSRNDIGSISIGQHSMPSSFHDEQKSSRNTNKQMTKLKHLYVLPVLFLEFLALALTRAVIPTLLLETFGDNVYFVMGCAEAVRGLLAFIACPLFGKVSDVVGRKACLLVTVFGTCSPVCSLAFMTWQISSTSSNWYGADYKAGGGEKAINVLDTTLEKASSIDDSIIRDSVEIDMQHRMKVFLFLLCLSGIFSSTFTLTFAYISDTVRRKKDRVTAYGMALATFGLSFTIGPMAGGYLARVESDDHPSNNIGVINEEAEEDSTGIIGEASSQESYLVHPLGQQRVFTAALILTIMDLLYIIFILPESNPRAIASQSPRKHVFMDSVDYNEDDDDDSFGEVDTVGSSVAENWEHIRKDILPNAWSPVDTIKLFSSDPFMREVGHIAFLYYTSLWAVVSTLVLYAAKRFHLGPERLGELMSALGLSTMISEAVLVRLVVPVIGEKKSMRLGLAAFILQCVVLGLAYEGWQLFICVLLSMVGNLVYPSLTSLVSGAVSQNMVGEALGAINGVKALTEGIGPLLFGTLMTFSEKSPLPGWPYLLAAVLAYSAFKRSDRLPDEEDEEYISEMHQISRSDSEEGVLTSSLNMIYGNSKTTQTQSESELTKQAKPSGEEYVSLLSDIEETDEEDFLATFKSQTENLKE